MRDLKQLFLGLKLALGIIWPLTAAAATQSFGTSLSSLSLLSVLMTLVIASLSGLTALLHHMKQDLQDNGEIKHLWLYVSSKMMGSNLAGLLMLFNTEGKYDANTQAALIIGASFGGTWLLDRALIYFADKFIPKKRATDD